MFEIKHIRQERICSSYDHKHKAKRTKRMLEKYETRIIRGNLLLRLFTLHNIFEKSLLFILFYWATHTSWFESKCMFPWAKAPILIIILLVTSLVQWKRPMKHLKAPYTSIKPIIIRILKTLKSFHLPGVGRVGRVWWSPRDFFNLKR